MSGPRPYRRPEFVAAQTVPAGFFFDRSARFVGDNDFKDRMSQRPCADVLVSDGPLFETGSGLPRSCETELKRLPSESESRLSRAGETELKILVPRLGLE